MNEESGSGDIEPTADPTTLNAAPLVFLFVGVVIVVAAISAWVTTRPKATQERDDINENLVDDSQV